MGSHGQANMVHLLCAVSNTKYQTCFAGAKAITIFNLIHLGLAKALNPSVYRSPKFGEAWDLLSDEKVRQYHTNLVCHLQDIPYGPWAALVHLVGQEMANHLAEKGAVKQRSLTTIPENEPTRKKRCLV